MARPTRLVVPGLPHLVLLQGHDGTAVLRDGDDAQLLLQTLQTLASDRTIELHAFLAQTSALWLLLTPREASALSSAVQWLGRRYVAAFNRRHGRSGTLWAGRFRAAVLQPGAPALLALQHPDALAGQPGAVLGSATSRTGEDGMAGPGLWLRQPQAYWSLGNTPFEREQAWRQRLEEPIPRADIDRLSAALRSGRAYGEASWLADLSRQLQRPLLARRPGRPKKSQDATMTMSPLIHRKDRVDP